MSNPYIGAIHMFAGSFAPRNWAFCNGQLMSINENQALYSLLGTTYGGDGRTTFALPDLRGRLPVHFGAGPGLTTRPLGLPYGSETETLTTNQMPAHNHTVNASSEDATSLDPSGNVAAVSTVAMYAQATVENEVDLAAESVANAGGGQPHSNMQLYQCLSFIISLEGMYPARN